MDLFHHGWALLVTKQLYSIKGPGMALIIEILVVLMNFTNNDIIPQS